MTRQIIYSTLSTETCPWCSHAYWAGFSLWLLTTSFATPHLELSYCQFSFRYLIRAGTLSYFHFFFLPGFLKLTIATGFWRNITTVQPSLQFFLEHFGQNKALVKYLRGQIVNNFMIDIGRLIQLMPRCLLFKGHSSHILNVVRLFPMRKSHSTNGTKSNVRCVVLWSLGDSIHLNEQRDGYESGIVQTESL